MNRLQCPSLIALAIVTASPMSSPRTVTTSVFVEDRQGAFVDRVDSEHLEILVGGIPAPILDVERIRSRIAVLVLFDLSFSATFGGRDTPAIGNDFSGVASELERVLLRSLGPDDELQLSGFVGQRFLATGRFVRGRRDQREAMRSFFGPVLKQLADIGEGRRPRTPFSVDDWFGPSPVWDAVVTATDLLAAVPEPRLTILVSDGEASGNRLRLTEAAIQAVRRSVSVHCVFEQKLSGPQVDPYSIGGVVLQRLARQTGGLYRTDDRLTRSGLGRSRSAFEDILAAARRAHRVRFTMLPGKSIESLEIRFRIPGSTVHGPTWLVSEPS